MYINQVFYKINNKFLTKAKWNISPSSLLLLPLQLPPSSKSLPTSTPMRTSENKNSSARPTETENGNMMLPPTPGPAHSRDTTEYPESQFLLTAPMLTGILSFKDEHHSSKGKSNESWRALFSIPPSMVFNLFTMDKALDCVMLPHLAFNPFLPLPQCI